MGEDLSRRSVPPEEASTDPLVSPSTPSTSLSPTSEPLFPGPQIESHWESLPPAARGPSPLGLSGCLRHLEVLWTSHRRV